MEKIGLHNYFVRSRINITEGYTQLNQNQCDEIKNLLNKKYKENTIKPNQIKDNIIIFINSIICHNK